jgi:valyl-tRNA synthetase
VLETGYDILFFWVARMIMSGLEYTGKPPFHTVYLHGLIRDEHGRKMSKTSGNVIDPLLVMDELGTDALRFTLLVGSTPGNDMNLSIKKVEANRNFSNKIWNAGRLISQFIDQAPDAPSAAAQGTLADDYIRARLRALVRSVNYLFENYQYGEAGRQIYEFFWSEFADWYLEAAKLQMAAGGGRAWFTAACALQVMDTCLRLLHPFTPFITEELWGHLKAAAQAHSSHLLPQAGAWEEALIVAAWPENTIEESWEAGSLAQFSLLQEIIRAIRNLRAEQNIPAARKLPAIFACPAETASLLESQVGLIAALARLEAAEVRIESQSAAPVERPAGSLVLVVGGIEIYLPIAEKVDSSAERQRLENELREIESQVARLESLLASPFAEKAPPAVVLKERERLAGYKETAEIIKAQIGSD